MGPHNLGQLLTETAARYPHKNAVGYKESGGYRWLTWSQFEDQVLRLRTALAAEGLRSGDRLAILSENRPEWIAVDMACQMLGVATVPIYPSLTAAEAEYILADSGARLIAVSSSAQLEKIGPSLKNLPLVKCVLAFDSAAAHMNWRATVPVIALREWLKKDPVQSPKDLPVPQSDAVASIIYTSGTTGVPKGVQLTHANFIQNAVLCRDTLKMSETDAHLSFLPLCHVFERLAGYYLMVYIGASIAYAESLDAVPQNLLEVRPTFILGVPRFYEKIKTKVLDAVQVSSSIRKGIFHWAKDLGAKRIDKGGSRITDQCQLFLAELLVFRKFRARLGGRVRFCISGGAPLSKDIAVFFAHLGVMIYEGYGLTETSPVISVNREEKYRFGTVGLPLGGGVEVKITEDGEIATRGPCVMKGYLNKPDETAAVMHDGWFHTGDLGCFDRDGFLVITGRKKELIVTSGGKKVAPQPIEDGICTDPYILRCVLFGEGRKFITALIVPQRERILEYAKACKIAYGTYEELLKNKAIYRLIEERIEDRSKNLANYEKIKYFHLLEEDFSQASGELTPTLKVKRDKVLNRYKNHLIAFYQENP